MATTKSSCDCASEAGPSDTLNPKLHTLNSTPQEQDLTEFKKALEQEQVHRQAGPALHVCNDGDMGCKASNSLRPVFGSPYTEHYGS